MPTLYEVDGPWDLNLPLYVQCMH